VKQISPAIGSAVYADPGYLVFVGNKELLAQRFDPAALVLSGRAVTLADHLESGYTSIAASDTGTVVYYTAAIPKTQLVWYRADGKRLTKLEQPGEYMQSVLSPDARRIAVERRDPATNHWNIWILDTDNGVFSRLTFGPSDHDVVWGPDSRQIIFGSDRNGRHDIFRHQIGSREDVLVYSDEAIKVPESWIPGGSILYTTDNGRKFHKIKLEPDSKPVLLNSDAFDRDEPHVSPRGDWIAYSSTESGRWEVYIASFPSFQNRRQVSKKGGIQPVWSSDGNQLFFIDLEGTMFSFHINSPPRPPRMLFESRVHVTAYLDEYGVTRDSRFVIGEAVDERPNLIKVIVNWPALMSHGSL
jgi:eukaryotic-like serine/threonine-protein kinase